MDVKFLKSAFRQTQFPPPNMPEIAFAGRSNVGKSSLINILVNRRGLARTSAKPGRTQAINFFELDRRLYLVDLPGYGYARVPVQIRKSWEQMVETYLRGRENLKAVVVILDIRREPTLGDKQLLEWLEHYGIHPIVVLTKADKLSRQQARKRPDILKRQFGGIFHVSPVLFSTKTRQGREELWKRIDAVC
ncbi:MAG: ribosome biogenesis GTP-binding protein YihA/YsxC [Desulfatiglandaceae bacterium]